MRLKYKRKLLLNYSQRRLIFGEYLEKKRNRVVKNATFRCNCSRRAEMEWKRKFTKVSYKKEETCMDGIHEMIILLVMELSEED